MNSSLIAENENFASTFTISLISSTGNEGQNIHVGQNIHPYS